MAAVEERPGQSVGRQRRQLWGITPHLRRALCMWPDLPLGPAELDTQEASLLQQTRSTEVPGR